MFEWNFRSTLAALSLAVFFCWGLALAAPSIFGHAVVDGYTYSAETGITGYSADLPTYVQVGAYTAAWGPWTTQDEDYDTSWVPGTATAASIGSFTEEGYGPFDMFCVASSAGTSNGSSWDFDTIKMDCEALYF